MKVIISTTVGLILFGAALANAPDSADSSKNNECIKCLGANVNGRFCFTVSGGNFNTNGVCYSGRTNGGAATTDSGCANAGDVAVDVITDCI